MNINLPYPSIVGKVAMPLSIILKPRSTMGPSIQLGMSQISYYPECLLIGTQQKSIYGFADRN